MSQSARYQVLARRYRPQTFSDVVGQESIVQTLKNAISKNSIAHGYLFSGSRGIGKTTLARLFAKAMNCSHLQKDGEPCNACPSCLDILSGQALDVLEIDGASNRGIDDIRKINETVGFAPSSGKYKIIIIDEVHMLTKEAFNALLKTLEEPPETVKFFFATTEPHKVPLTILSRCQRFDLGRLLPTQIADRLMFIVKDIGREASKDALFLLAQYSDGSLRDAESLLDQILVFTNEKITVADVQNVLGTAPQDLFFSLDDAFTNERFSYAFELIETLFQTGKDLAHFLDELTSHFRNIIVCKTRGVLALELTEELRAAYTKAAAHYTQAQCFFILDLLLKTEAKMSKTLSARVTLELTLLQILRAKHRIPIEALVRRLSEIEKAIEGVAIETKQNLVTNPPETNDTPIKEQAPTDQEIVPTKIQGTPEGSISLSPAEVTTKIENVITQAKPPEPIKDLEIKPKVNLDTASKNTKHPSHYDTLIRFTAVELDGSCKIV